MSSIIFKFLKNIIIVTLVFSLQILLPFKKLLADDIYVGVASNFLTPLNDLKKLFEKKNKVKIFISSGSSGGLYSQIVNGAPLDIFLSGDQYLPQKLESTGIGIKGSRFTYATGKLLLFSTNNTFFREELPDILTNKDINYIGIGNPQYVPYGMAAKEVLHSLGLFNQLSPKLILSKNVNQVFVMTFFGNLDLGFISKSDFVKKNQKGKVWEIPQNLYSPIEQDAILLKNGKKNENAKLFLQFLSSDQVKDKLKKFGYVFN